MSDVFCDYLAVTCSPEKSFVDYVEDLLRSRLVCSVEKYEKKTLIRFAGPYGIPALVRIDRDFHNRVDRVAFGGLSLEVLRGGDLLTHVVQELVSVPHNVTRIDVARDVELRDVNHFGSTLRKIRGAGHRGKIRLSRKSVLPHKVKAMLGPRALDSVFSGSVMFNHRSDRYSGIVYDKTSQLFERHGVVIESNLMRYEFRSTDASLRDVLAPESLFYSMASPDLLPCPPGISDWQKTELAPLNLEPLPKLTDWQRIQRILDYSLDLEALDDLLKASSPGTVQMARRKLNERLDVVLKAQRQEAEAKSA